VVQSQPRQIVLKKRAGGRLGDHRKYSLPTGEGLHLIRKQAYKDLSIR
jgi:hypothetical protein